MYLIFAQQIMQRMCVYESYLQCVGDKRQVAPLCQVEELLHHTVSVIVLQLMIFRKTSLTDHLHRSTSSLNPFPKCGSEGPSIQNTKETGINYIISLDR